MLAPFACPTVCWAAMAKDQRYLRLHRRQWHVVLAVPRPLQAALGRTQFKTSLHTDSLSKARRLRWPVVERMRREIARAEAVRAASSKDPLVADALEWRALRPEIVGEADPDEAQAVYKELIREEAMELAKAEGKAGAKPKNSKRARRFLDFALGTATPLMLYRDQWLNEMDVIPRTRQERRTTLSMLETWAGENDLGALQDITRKAAGDFLAQRLIGAGLAHKSIRKRLSDLAVHWSWLASRGHLGDEPPPNPWRGHEIPAPRKGARGSKRPFTDDEVARLLYDGSPDEVLRDYMWIAALSGMRIAEIAGLTVGDCADGMFNVSDSKTEAGVRQVPIHSSLKRMIARRVKGRPLEAHLVDDNVGVKARKRGETWDPSMPVSKRFGRYRQTVGVHDRAPGQRASAVDFHSFRRWFATKAEQAGVPESTTASVMGHERQGMTHGLYSGGPSRDQLRKCVEAVKLPGRRQGR